MNVDIYYSYSHYKKRVKQIQQFIPVLFIEGERKVSTLKILTQQARNKLNSKRNRTGKGNSHQILMHGCLQHNRN